jgi:hypothetical protein
MHVAGVSVRRLVPEKRRDRDDRHLAGRRGRSDNRRERVPALDRNGQPAPSTLKSSKCPGCADTCAGPWPVYEGSRARANTRSRSGCQIISKGPRTDVRALSALCGGRWEHRAHALFAARSERLHRALRPHDPRRMRRLATDPGRRHLGRVSRPRAAARSISAMHRAASRIVAASGQPVTVPLPT